MKIYSRDKTDDNGVESANYFDYQYFLLQKNKSESDKYSTQQKKALIKLIFLVIETELTDIQRRVVILTKIKGLKGKEVANLLGVNPSTVSRELKSAQRKFDRAYEHYSCIKRSIMCE